MSTYSSSQAYYEDLEQHAILPEGFVAGACETTFLPVENPTAGKMPIKLAVLMLEKPTNVFSAVFTKNAFPGHPVVVGKRLLKQNLIQGVLVNNKIANVCTDGGEAHALELLDRAEHVLELSRDGSVQQGKEVSRSLLFPSSTGVIGWKLPVEPLAATLPKLKQELQTESVLPFAKAIMTTDAYPKVVSRQVGDGRIVGVAKGAGMIEPNMATMLSFISTDLTLSREEAELVLRRTVEDSFNKISVDSDQSTSDSVFLFSSCRKSSIPLEEFEQALGEICRELAELIVKNGEGTSHLIDVQVKGFSSNKIACAAAKAVINSPLVKTAVYGDDPNVGRILMALGDFAGSHGITIGPKSVLIDIGNERVFENGAVSLDIRKEKVLADYFRSCRLSEKNKQYPEKAGKVMINICLDGPGRGFALGSDLSHEYIHENADYRS